MVIEDVKVQEKKCPRKPRACKEGTEPAGALMGQRPEGPVEAAKEQRRRTGVRA